MRVLHDNDYFTGTDEQYSEGVDVELVMPWIKDFPLSRALVHPHFADIKYGIGAEQAGYTPFDLPSEGMPVNDRPYAGTFMLKSFLMANDAAMLQRFSTTLSIGIIGPWAQADNLQKAAHVITDNVQPPGWRYQVKNDLILNYQVNYEKEIAAYRNLLLVNAEATARAGTFSDRAGGGLVFIAGIFESPFSSVRSKHSRLQLYVYDNPLVEVVGYDATLEGGMFNHDSPYKFTGDGISPVVFSNRMGLVLGLQHFHFEYYENYVTNQFRGGPVHLYGGVQIAYLFDGNKKTAGTIPLE